MESWHDIWSRRQHQAGPDELQSLIDMDGFDSGAGRIVAADWRIYAHQVAQKLELQKGQSVFEVGCGSGAFLYALREEGARIVGGVDFAEELIKVARSTFIDGTFSHADASQIEGVHGADYLVANGVFHYFPDLQYAQVVLENMLTKANIAIAVLEVPDLALRDSSESSRRAARTEGEYDQKYAGLKHQYYGREWFQTQAARLGVTCRITTQFVPNYAQSQFRFNAFLYK